MTEYSNLSEQLILRVSEYSNTGMQLIKLKAVKRGAQTGSLFIAHVISFFIIAIFFLLLNVGLALWIGKTVGEIYLGFIIVSILLVLLWIIFRIFLFKWIIRKTGNSLINNMLN
jgi:hypothetical protein